MKRHGSMNHIYRLIWSKVLNGWVAVVETSRGRGKSSSRKLIAAALSLTGAVALAAPGGGQVAAGAGSIVQSGTTTTITQASQNLALNWRSFNVAAQETVNFVQPSKAAIAVNRISDTNGSQILGHLNANGQVYLINPNGILFGQGAQVNVGGLVASTLDLNDASLSGNARAFAGSGSGSVVNQGSINAATGGYVALLGNTVSNQGTITAQLGTVALGAGSAATLNFNGNSLVQMQVAQSVLNSLAENGGLIRADGGVVLMNAGARDTLLASVVNNTGVIEARTVENHDGIITLQGGAAAGSVNVSGTLDASAHLGGSGGTVKVLGDKVGLLAGASIDVSGDGGGGTALIGGNFHGAGPEANASQVNIDKGAVIDADAITRGNGGQVAVWADGHTRFAGSISARGGAESGDGGFVETSGKGTLDFIGAVDTRAANGKTGTLLLDPTDITITDNDSATMVNNGGVFSNTGAASSSNLSASRLETALGNSSVIVDTASSGSGAGAITVAAPVSWDANQLTLKAGTNITINASLNAYGNASLALRYGQGALAAGNLGTYSVNAQVNLPAGNHFSTMLGSDGAVKNYTVITSLGAAGSTTAADLQGMNGNLSANYALGSNINASATATWNGGAGFVPVGNSSDVFSGNFDGLNHTISQLSINRPGTDYVGLFGLIVSSQIGSAIRNVGMDGGSIYGRKYVGELTGAVGNSTSAISNSYASGSVKGTMHVGGLVGYSYGPVSNSYATGTVSGASYVGGLMGANAGMIIDSYATGSVSGTAGTVGGLAGLSSGSITSSHWNSDTTSTGIGSGTQTGATGLSTAAMQSQSSFNDWSSANTSNSGKVWRLYEGHTAPLLAGFLTGLTLGNTALTYNGGSQNGVNAGYANVDRASGTNVGAYTAYSNQQGYDITGGNLTIAKAALSINAVTDSKIYSGDTNSARSVSITGLIAGDTVSGSSQSFGSKNVLGANASTLSVNNGFVVNDGNNGGNYAVSTNTATGTITRLGSVTWIGGSTGNWSQASNWAGNAIPDLANVKQVIIPAGKSVMFDANVGTTGAVQLDSISSSGALAISSGTLTVAGNLATSRYTQTGGTVAAGSLNASNYFHQTDGSLAVSGNVNINQASGAVVLGDASMATLTLTSNGDISQTAATGLTVSGATTLAAGTSNINLINVGNDFGGSVNLTGGAASVRTQNGLSLNGSVSGNLTTQSTTLKFGNTSVTGNLTATASGAITQSASLSVGGSTIIHAAGQSVTLNNPGNNLSGALTLAAAATQIVDVAPLTAHLNTTGATSIISANGLTFDGSVMGDLSTQSAALTFGPTAISGSLSATASGAVSQRGPLAVAGTGTIAAAGQSVTLNNPGNSLSGALTLAAAATQIVDVAPLTAHLNTTGATSIFSANGLTVDGSVMGNLGTQSAALNFGATAVTGNLTTFTSGAVSQSGPLAVAGASTITAAGQSVTLNNAGNDFGGALSLVGAAVQIVDANALTAHVNTADISIISRNGLTVDGSVTGNLSTQSAALNLGATAVTGNLTTFASGAVSQSGPLAVAGTSNIAAAGQSVTLNNSGNNLVGALTVAGAATQIVDTAALTAHLTTTDATSIVSANGLMLDGSVKGNLTAIAGGAVSQIGALQVTVSTAIAAAGQSVTLDNGANDFGGALNITSAAARIVDMNALTIGGNIAGDLTLRAAALTFAPTTVGGNLAATAGGAVGQTGALLVTGHTSIAAAGQSVMLNNAGNDFGGALTVTGAATQIVDTNALVAHLDTSGATGLTAVNGLTLDGRAGGDLSIHSAALNFGPTTIGGNLTAAAGGAVSQSGALLVAGSSGIAAAGQAVTLGNTANDFGGALTLASAASQIADKNTLTAHLSTTGTSSITAASDLTLDGSIGADVSTHSAALTFGATRVTGNLTAAATGTVNQTGALSVSGNTGIAASGQTVTLINATNVFGGPLSVASAAAQIVDMGALTAHLSTRGPTSISSGMTLLLDGNVSGDLTTLSNALALGATTIAGKFNATATGAVSQTGVLNVGGSTGIAATGQSVTLSNPGNNFGGALSVAGAATRIVDTAALTAHLNTTGATSLTAVNSLTVDGSVAGNLSTNSAALSFGATTVSGNLIAAASGVVNQSGALTVAGSTGVAAAGQTVALNNAGNNFGGALSLTGAATQLVGVAALTAHLATTGATSVSSASALTLDGGIAGDLNTSSSALTLGTTTVAGTFNAAAMGAVSQTGALNVGALKVNTGANASLGNITSSGAISVSADAITVVAPITWNDQLTTLRSNNTININASLNGAGAASLALQYGQGTLAAGNLSAYNVNAPVNLPAGPNLSTLLGSNGVVKNFTVITGLGAQGSTNSMDLQGMNGGLSTNYALGANIDATATSGWNGGAGFAPLGNGNNFTGTFDGLGHILSNFTINRPSTSLLGLFGGTGAGAVIQNVGMIGGSVSGFDEVGMLVGGNNSAMISNSYATGSVSGHQWVGGLVGYNNATVGNSYATGSVNGLYQVGGLVGGNNSAISNSYATGSVSGTTWVGGLAGYSNGTVSTSYASGSVSGPSYVGGLVGYSGNGTVNNSYWNTTTSGQSSSGGGMGLTALEMQTASNFTGFTFTTSPGAAGNNWVMVDVNGGLNNAGGSLGAVHPMLASEYSTTVANAHQLQLMAMAPAASYTLGSNVNAAATANGSDVWFGAAGSSGFVPVGNASTKFAGSFDGLGRTISNLNINRTATSDVNVALFGDTAPGSMIQNVGLLGGSVTGYGYVGGLVGLNNGTVSNSHTTGSVSGNGYIVGGLAGFNNGTVSNSYATGSVSGASEVGGLVGQNQGTVSQSHAMGNVSGTGDYVGGLVGFSSSSAINNSYATGSVSAIGADVGGLAGFNNGKVSNSYATGSVSGSASVGGLVGLNVDTISNSYATGSVSGASVVGGLVGLNYSTVSNSYATGGVSGAGNAIGGLIGNNAKTVTASYWNSDVATTGIGIGTQSGATGLSTAAMQSAASFNGWSIANTSGSSAVWRIYEGSTTPLLRSFLTPLTVTSNAVSKTYDALAYADTTGVTYSLPNPVLSGSLYRGAVNVGTYAAGGLLSGQQGYDIAYVGGVLTITPAILTAVGTRAYDGTLNIAASMFTLNGLVNGQNLILSGATTTPDKNVASHLAVSLGSLALADGANGLASNYTLIGGAANASVTAKALSATASASNKTYDGSTAATPAPVLTIASAGFVSGETVTATATGSFNTKDVLTANLVTVNSTTLHDGTGGGLASNYSLASGETASAGISKANLAVTGITASNKVYNTNTVATLAGKAAVSVFSGDSVTLNGVGSGTFADKNVGLAKAVTVSGFSLSGTDAGNYALAQPLGLSATITAAQLAIKGLSVKSKVYDGTASATLIGMGAVSALAGDSITLGGSAIGTFATSGTGNGQAVTVSGYTLSGADAGNYVIVAPAGLRGNILAP